MTSSIAARALALAARTGPAPGPAATGRAGHVHRLRVRLVRDVAVMLNVSAASVTATDDPVRRPGGQPWHLITVCDPDDPTTRYRFLPEPGLGGVYTLLDECPDCGAPEVPMATVSGLSDLGRYLTATRPVPPGAPDPDDHENGRPDLPDEFLGDPGHHRHCAIGRPTHLRDVPGGTRVF